MGQIVTFSSLGRYGRLANQMYQIAGTIGIARRNGFEFAFPEWKNYDHQEKFGFSEDINVQDYFVNSLPRYDGPALPDRFVHWGYHDVDLSESVSLSGHMQSFKYFAHCFEEVKHYFRMKEEAANDYCAIHLRLGDYDDAYHPRLGRSYYEPAMRLFPADQKFLVFSDDILAARRMIEEIKIFNTGITVDYSMDRDYMADFRLMKTCRHFIIGNSTFSSMAAVLGEGEGKKVVAPRPWFGPKYTEITGEDIYNDDWIVINYT